MRLYSYNRCKDQPKLFNSFGKYGYENHIKNILQEFQEGVSQKEINDAEIYWINHYNSIKGGLNIKEGGSNGKMSEETKLKLSNAKSGHNHPYFGKKLPKEWCDNLSKARKGRKLSEECKRKIGLAHKGKKLSQQHIAKLIFINKGKKISEETKEKLRFSSTGKIHSDATKKICSEKTKERWNNGIYGSNSYIEKIRNSKIGIPNMKLYKKILCNETGEIFESIQKASEKINGNKKCGNIVSQLKGRLKTAYGYTFSYV